MKIKIISVICLSLLVILTLCACGGGGETNTETNTNTDTQTNEVVYTVRAVDYKGEPISSGLFVEITKDGEEMGFKKANANGEASFTLAPGEYNFSLTIAEEGLFYNTEETTLTEKSPSKEVMLYKELGDDIFVMSPYDKESGERYEYHARFVEEGATLVPIDGMTYYVFEPTRSGIYKFSYLAERAINIGYYGGSEHYVFSESTIEIKDRAFEIEVKEGGVSNLDGGTTHIIIGISSLTVDSCYLTVERIADPTQQVQRNEYIAKEVPSTQQKYNYLNGVLKNIDITDDNLTIVYNSADGYYHLNSLDGEIVLMRISSASQYIASFIEMCETTALLGANYDSEGNPASYDVYNTMFEKYAERCDDAGVVPLTRELLTAVTKIGEYKGWFEGELTIFRGASQVDPSTGDVILGDVIEITEENAPYFACCYLEKTDAGTNGGKITITDTIEDKDLLLFLSSQETLSIKSSRQVKSILKIEDAEGIKVIVGETEYTQNENGELEITFEGGAPIEFSVVSTSQTDKKVSFTFTTFVLE